MKISSDDIAPILTAAGGFITIIAGVVTNLIMTIRQGKRITKHGSDIEDLKSSTGNFKSLKPPSGV